MQYFSTSNTNVVDRTAANSGGHTTYLDDDEDFLSLLLPTLIALSVQRRRIPFTLGQTTTGLSAEGIDVESSVHPG
jgi:hypothetical protein